MSASNPSTALAETLVDEFIRCGVEHACISPGSRSAPLALAIAARRELTKHVILDERSASFTALGIAKRTRIPALLVCTSGTAGANFLPAVHEAKRAGVPMLVLTADRPPELRDTGANQTTDQIKIFGDAVNSFTEIGAPESLPTSNMYWRSVAARSFASATGAHRGPAHLNVAFREPLVPVDRGEDFPFDTEGRPGGAPWHREITPTVQVPHEVKRRIERAERGLIVAGHLEDGGEGVTELAAALGWPLISEATSNARRPALSVDHYDLILESERFRGSDAPDLVLRFGSAGLSKNLARLLGLAPQILVDARETWLDAGRTAEVKVRSNAGDFCRSLAHDLPTASTRSGWPDSWQDAAETARSVLQEDLAQHGLCEPLVARSLVALCAPHSQLVVGASMPIRDVDNFSAARSDVKLFANRGLNGIDGFDSTAIGIAAASNTPTFALCGDLTFLHDQNALLDPARRGIDLTFVVVNNNGGGIFSFLPQAELPEHFEEVFGTPQAIDLSRLCGAHDIEHHEIDSVSDFDERLSSSGTLRVLEISTDRAANVVLHSQLREHVRSALD